MNPDAALERAAALLDLRRPHEALEHLHAAFAVAHGPEHEWGHRIRAAALIHLGPAPDARLRAYQRAGTGEQFEAAARLDPSHAIVRHNLLHTGPAGRSFAYRRFSAAALALAVFMAAAGPGVLTFVLLAGVRGLEVRRLSAPTRQLLNDDRRARRLKPLRLCPWWWLVFAQLLRGLRRSA